MFVRKREEQAFEPIDIEGVEYCRLRRNASGSGGATLVRIRSGARYPAHHHPGWEQALVLSGRMTVGGQELAAGEYWFTESGEVHDAVAVEDVTFFVITEEDVEVV